MDYPPIASPRQQHAIHIYFIGRLSIEHPGSYFHIISKDTGFDPLIRYLKAQKVLCQRSASIDGIPLVRLIHSKSLPDKVEAVVENLARRKAGRPRTLKTLGSTIRALFQGQLSDDELEKLTEALVRRGVVLLHDGKVSYALPD